MTKEELQADFIDMKQNKDTRYNFLERWKKNDRRFNSFNLKDGNSQTGLPAAWTIVEAYVDQITDSFDGSAIFDPPSDVTTKTENQYVELTKVYNEQNTLINVQGERKLMLLDAFKHGTGCLFDGFIKQGEGIGSFDGLFEENCDMRDIFWSSGAQTLFDPLGHRSPHTIVRRKWQERPSVKKNYLNDKYKQDNVQKMLSIGVDNQLFREQEGVNEHSQVLHGQSEKISLFQVLEFWTDDELIITLGGNNDDIGEIIFHGENPYKRKPFSFYQPFRDSTTILPPSLLEILAGLLGEKEVLNKAWQQDTILSSLKMIFASKETGLRNGAQLKPGIQTFDPKDKKIGDMIQQYNFNSRGDVLQNRQNFLEREIQETAAIDTRSFTVSPDETATKTKGKQSQTLKRLRGVTHTFMVTGEMQRAANIANNIIRFIFSDDRDILVRDTRKDDRGKLVNSKGNSTTIQVDSKAWKEFPYKITIKTKQEEAINAEEKRNSVLRLLEVFQVMLNTASPEDQQKLRESVDMVSLFQEVTKTFPELDTDKIFVRESGQGVIEDEINRTLAGDDVEPTVFDEDARTLGMQQALGEMGKAEGGDKTKLLRHLARLQNAQIQPEPVPVAIPQE